MVCTPDISVCWITIVTPLFLVIIVLLFLSGWAVPPAPPTLSTHTRLGRCIQQTILTHIQDVLRQKVSKSKIFPKIQVNVPRYDTCPVRKCHLSQNVLYHKRMSYVKYHIKIFLCIYIAIGLQTNYNSPKICRDNNS